MSLCMYVCVCVRVCECIYEYEGGLGQHLTRNTQSSLHNAWLNWSQSKSGLWNLVLIRKKKGTTTMKEWKEESGGQGESKETAAKWW